LVKAGPGDPLLAISVNALLESGVKELTLIFQDSLQRAVLPFRG
jgi:hypothetical protein